MSRHDLDEVLPQILKEYESGASASQLAKKHKASVWSIIARLNAAGVHIRSNKEQNEKRLNLTPKQKSTFVSIVDGMLLGDGRVGPKGELRLEQSIDRRGWLDHISESLASVGSTSRIIKVAPRDRIIKGRVVRYRGGHVIYTPCYVECQEQRNRWYPNGKRSVPKDVALTPLSIAYWFAGDGSYDKSGCLFLYTNSFTKDGTQRLADGLTQLGVEARCVPVNRKNEHKVAITKKLAACRLKEIIEAHMPECCMYKLRYVRPPIVRIYERKNND